MAGNLLWLALGLVIGALAVAVWAGRRQTRLAADAARLEAEFEAAHRALETERARVAEMQAQLRDTFAALSRDALKENRSDFLHNADALLKPMRETLDRVQSHLNAVDKAREGSHQAVASQLQALAGAQEQLRGAAEGLSRALRSPNVRGQWGEV